MVAAASALAGSATWAPSSGATVGDWNTASNWSPQTVPNKLIDGIDATATFAHSFTTGVSIAAHVEVNGITFASSMFPSAYTISVNPSTFVSLFISGVGITNNSGLTQNFVTGVGSTSSSNAAAIEFGNSATAGTSTVFTNNGATATNASGAATEFHNSATAGSGTFVNNGALGVTAGSGGFTELADSAHAGSATFIANGGSNGGEGGKILFFNDSTGDTARIEVFNNGALDISGHNAPGVGVGSIEGNGAIFLGARNLSVGSSNRSTAFSGALQDGGFNHGTGGSLTKIGTGKLTLNFASFYTGGTTINKGTLLVKNKTGSATGPGPVQVNAGTLGGVGHINGAVILGNGATSGAILLAGNSKTSPGTLTINNTLTFNSLSTYKCVLNRSSGKASQVNALGVTINSNVPFTFIDTGSGTLALGTVFTVINNTSANPIFGTFSNLADGSTFTSNGTHFKANYKGGTGNDLTLKVVP
jgi:autotransporter-associated beta strand protein